ncbi:hypothetical protein E3U43_005236 [Larimichthys crocea]|uniref:Uncharacterized protein n=1 Tax=Larimichthys crocea TaxID=215358 RepID=A0ACD3QH23_LARCR|nr:hypothetical protein E3U43_005236 [Larimichthys crocea]
MPDSIILPQENSSFRKEPQSDHVLKTDEVYSEPPYKSLWLNVNEDLDDIDKEFGFPWSLKHHLPVIEIHSEPEQSETINSNPAQLVDLGEEKQTSTVEATTTQAASPNKTESTDSSDPYYSFEIKVLPPEEARIIFEQTQSKMPQSMDKDSHPEKNSLVGVELPEAEDRDVTLNDSTVKNTTGRPIEQHRLSLTRRRSLPDNLKSGKEKTKMDVVPLEQPADKDSRNTKNGSHGGKPHQENSVLTFNVLPSTFNFKNRSNEGKEINGSFTNKTALDEGKDSSPNKPLTKERGTWYPNLEKKHCPLRSPPVLKNKNSIFHKFQKKYKEKTQPLMKE